MDLTKKAVVSYLKLLASINLVVVGLNCKQRSKVVRAHDTAKTSPKM